jgi:hypothetical protein
MAAEEKINVQPSPYTVIQLFDADSGFSTAAREAAFTAAAPGAG